MPTANRLTRDQVADHFLSLRDKVKEDPEGIHQLADLIVYITCLERVVDTHDLWKEVN